MFVSESKQFRFINFVFNGPFMSFMLLVLCQSSAEIGKTIIQEARGVLNRFPAEFSPLHYAQCLIRVLQ